MAGYTLLKVPDTELRMSTIDYLELVLRETLEAGSADGPAGPPNLVLDLSDVRFADTAALRVIITAANRCGKEGGQVVLLHVHPAVQKVLRLGGVNFIEFAESLSEAESFFSS